MIADLRVDVWLPQIEALFDVWVTDTDAPSYITHSVPGVLATAEEVKKHSYVAIVLRLVCTFVVTVDDTLAHSTLPCTLL